jgi:peptide-methionine (S)-S-oxide reductase
MEEKLQKAIFSAGCFWGVEEAFRKISGVVDVKVGYTGGDFHNPTYNDVCSGSTGHAEAIEITFYTKNVSYGELLDVFWKIHDPTQEDGQGFDIGNQYRSAIFYLNEEQKNIAEESKNRQNGLRKYSKKITTEITDAKEFFEAEEYHQQYLSKKKNKGIS